MRSIFNTLRYLLKKIISHLIKINKNMIIILDETPYSGSNAYAIYKTIPEEIRRKDILVTYMQKINDSRNIRGKVKRFIELNRAKIIITTHRYDKYKSSQILIQLWHGIPLKSMGLMDNKLDAKLKQDSVKLFKNYKTIISTAPFYSTLLNACVGSSADKYVITGLPRNDFLFSMESRYKLERVMGKNLVFNSIIFYVPTFKCGYGGRTEGNTREENIFGFDSFDFQRFLNFLSEREILFVVKLHPFEEKMIESHLSKYKSDNFIILHSSLLSEHNCDLYELIGTSDLLVTDYSSIYFDYLLLDKPIIFINNDINTYRSTRGFLLEPYDFWTPGPKVKNQQQLKEEINKCINDKSYYKNERKMICDIFHTNKDKKASSRVWKIIEDEL